MKLSKFLSLSKAECWILTIMLVAWGVWLSGILQITILSKDPQIHIYGPASYPAPPGQLIIMLHSANSSGADLAYLAEFYAPHFPDAVFVAPDSPSPSHYRPFTFSWFNRAFTPIPELEKKVSRAAPWLENFITGQQQEHNLPAEKTFIIGHSQGGVMGLYVALKNPGLVAGVLSFSGYLVGNHDLQESAHENLQLHLVHGTDDLWVPEAEYNRALTQLKKAGFTVYGTLIPGTDHDINITGAQAGLHFLQRIWP